MTGAEYIKAQNAAYLRAARAALVEVLPGPEYGVDEQRLQAVQKALFECDLECLRSIETQDAEDDMT